MFSAYVLSQVCNNNANEENKNDETEKSTTYRCIAQNKFDTHERGKRCPKPVIRVEKEVDICLLKARFVCDRVRVSRVICDEDFL